MSRISMLKVDFGAIEKRAWNMQMNMVELSEEMGASQNYMSQVKSRGEISKLKYKQLIRVLKVPNGTFLCGNVKDDKPTTFGEMLSDGEIKLEEFTQQHTSTEPEQIELISVEQEMLLEMKNLTSTMKEILNVLKGWE